MVPILAVSIKPRSRARFHHCTRFHGGPGVVGLVHVPVPEFDGGPIGPVIPRSSAKANPGSLCCQFGNDIVVRLVLDAGQVRVQGPAVSPRRRKIHWCFHQNVLCRSCF